MAVRTAEPADLPRFEKALRQWGHPNRTEHLQALLLAVHEDRVVGCCRSSFLEEISSYDQMEWVWAATSVGGFGYVHGLYVDPAYRCWGLGAALGALAFDTLFDRGCRDVRAWIPSAVLQARYRRWRSRCVGTVMSMMKREV